LLLTISTLCASAAGARQVFIGNWGYPQISDTGRDVAQFNAKIAAFKSILVRELCNPVDERLNDDVNQFISGREAKNELAIANVSPSGLHVTRPTAKYLLAMKLAACRTPLPGYTGDFKDIEILPRVTRISSVKEAQSVVDSFFPDTNLLESVKAVLNDTVEPIQREPH
jgi:hypothetical protein